MKEGWINSRIGDICSITDFVSNGSFASLRENVKYYNSPNYAVLVRLADASNGFDKSKFVYTDEHGYDFLKKSHLHGGELIMSNVGSVGSMFICPVMAQPMTLAPNTISITSQNNKFLYYYFLSDGFKKKLKGITSSTTLKKFNKTNFKLLEIPIPPLSEQQSIVDYLDSAFAKIDTMKANAEKALNEAKALFQASLKEMLEPKEGWEEKKIKDIGSVIAGTTPNTNVAEYWDGSLCWISPAELDGSHYLYDSKKKITEAAVKAKSLKLLPEGTVILSSRAPIGKVVINKVPTYCNQGFKCVVCGKDIYNEFLYWWFWGNTDYLNSLGTGATFKEISKKVVEEITLPIPPIFEQQSIVTTLDSLKSKVDRLQENYEKISQECDALKQAILRQVFE